ncbi:MAG: hypothetical protein IH594_03930, partial [Bacteroidales bacterium]|nr:hypothetical protein [Bacteroidales bacterium]
MSPPPDADKPTPILSTDASCYMATASNMLAGAGYGNGTSVQARAEDIYGNMRSNLAMSGGWTDAAISWWLSSSFNTWSTNPYTIVTVYGNKNPKYPWANPDGAKDIGNYLRECRMVGLSISWPTSGTSIGSGGHAITAWGDNFGKETITTNPSLVKVTDSDNDSGGDIQNYNYDSYTAPNPSGPNEGNGWYIDYDPNHPYIKHIVTLSSVENSIGQKQVQRVLGSYKIFQADKFDATDLHYIVGTDVPILSYKTSIDYSSTLTPDIVESTPQLESLIVDWDLKEMPVPYGTNVIISTEFMLPFYNGIGYSDVYFTNPDSIKQYFPDINWIMITPLIEKAEAIPNVTGGYVIGSFDILNPDSLSSKKIIGEYRFIHEYSFNQSPEEHDFILSSEIEYKITNLRFGHSYGYLDSKSLWSFELWMTRVDEEIKITEKPFEYKVDW